MNCPLPKCFRHRFVSECKPMHIGQNDEDLKRAAFVFVERHRKFAAVFEQFVYMTPAIERKGEKIGKYRITVEQITEEESQ